MTLQSLNLRHQHGYDNPQRTENIWFIAYIIKKVKNFPKLLI